jgi:hypothetical protein
LLKKLRERASSRHGGSLRSTDRFSAAAELWFEQLSEMVAEGRRSPGTRDAYRRKLDNHVLRLSSQAWGGGAGIGLGVETYCST